MARAREGSLVAFFLLTYIGTWATWISAWLLSGGAESARYPGPGIPTMLFYLGVFAPAFVAVALTARHEGRSGVGALLGRLIQWRAGLRWYVFAPTYMAAIKLTAAPEGVAARLADGQFAVDLCRFFLLRMRAKFGRRRR